MKQILKVTYHIKGKITKKIPTDYINAVCRKTWPGCHEKLVEQSTDDEFSADV